MTKGRNPISSSTDLTAALAGQPVDQPIRLYCDGPLLGTLLTCRKVGEVTVRAGDLKVPTPTHRFCHQLRLRLSEAWDAAERHAAETGRPIARAPRLIVDFTVTRRDTGEDVEIDTVTLLGHWLKKGAYCNCGRIPQCGGRLCKGGDA